MGVLSGNREFEEAQNVAREDKNRDGGSSMYNVLAKMIKNGRNEGWNDGRNEGRNEERFCIQTLMSRMFSEGRVDDLRRASTDSDYLNQLLEEQGLLEKDAELQATS